MPSEFEFGPGRGWICWPVRFHLGEVDFDTGCGWLWCSESDFATKYGWT